MEDEVLALGPRHRRARSPPCRAPADNLVGDARPSHPDAASGGFPAGPPGHRGRAHDRQSRPQPDPPGGGRGVAPDAPQGGRPVGAQARRRRLDGVWLERVRGSAGRPRFTGRSQSSPADRLGGHCNRHQRRRVAERHRARLRPSSTGRAASSTSSMRRRRGSALRSCPAISATSSPRLARALPDPVPELARELWIVTHSDLKRTARVRAFFDVVGAGLAADRALFEGREPTRARRPDMSMKLENIDTSCQRGDGIDTSHRCRLNRRDIDTVTFRPDWPYNELRPPVESPAILKACIEARAAPKGSGQLIRNQ